MQEIVGIEVFTQTIESSSGLHLVECWGSACAPCLSQKEILNRIENHFPQIGFFTVNVELELDIAVHLGVRGLPLLLVFKDGEEIQRWNGLIPEKDIVESLSQISRQI